MTVEHWTVKYSKQRFWIKKHIMVRVKLTIIELIVFFSIFVKVKFCVVKPYVFSKTTSVKNV